MAEGGEKRNPSTHRTPSQVKRHSRTYQADPDQVKKRVKRNQARAAAMKAGKVKKGDGKDVGHKKPLSRGGTNAPSNLAVQSQATNRGHGMSKGGNGKKKSPSSRKK